ncbi:hypothetical protein IKG10_00460 [Candidatus Saccharibacteria bacterium]|nr:hypothetical protein [Candidatus Saccharibacteria bacterium]
MIKIFTGDDRIRAKKAILDFLGNDYELFDATTLDPADLPNIFLGTSLFGTERKIVLRDLSENKAVFEKILDYLDTPHKIAFFETKLDKRSSVYKQIKDKIEICEYSLPKNLDYRIVFDIYKTAKKDGKKAVAMLERIKINEDPINFAGLLNSQAIKDFATKPGVKEKKALKELSRLDLNLKNSKLNSWLLIESFLLRLSSL